MSELDAELQKFLAELHADNEKFDRQQRVRHRVAMWMLIPYLAAAVTVGWAVGQVAEQDLRDAVLIGVAVAVIILCQWWQPWWTRRLILNLDSEFDTPRAVTRASDNAQGERS